MCISVITKHFMCSNNGVNLEVRMKNTVPFDSPDFKQHSQGVDINRLQYPISIFFYFPKGIHGKIFTQGFT